MFIHLGGDVVVIKKEVITILNQQLIRKNETNREFMRTAESEGFITRIGEKDNVNSVIVTTKKVYLSPISSMTLKKRSDELFSNLDSFNS